MSQCPCCGQERRQAERRRDPRGGRRASDVFSPMEVALRTGLTYNQVIVDIRAGELKAHTVIRGQRTRYLVSLKALTIWATRLGLGINGDNGVKETDTPAA